MAGRGTVVLGGAMTGVATGGSSSLSESNVRSTMLLWKSLRMLGAVVVIEATVRRDKSDHPVFEENRPVVNRVNVPQRHHHDTRTTRPLGRDCEGECRVKWFATGPCIIHAAKLASSLAGAVHHWLPCGESKPLPSKLILGQLEQYLEVICVRRDRTRSQYMQCNIEISCLFSTKILTC
jgi:hypothetical protein